MSSSKLDLYRDFAAGVILSEASSQFIKSEKHRPQSPFRGKICWITTFCIAFYESYLSAIYPHHGIDGGGDGAVF
jgi:hypothetical protein